VDIETLCVCVHFIIDYYYYYYFLALAPTPYLLSPVLPPSVWPTLLIQLRVWAALSPNGFWCILSLKVSKELKLK